MAQPVTVTEFYSPSTDQWTIVKPLTNVHKEASHFLAGKYVYIFGGYNITAKTGQKLMSRYDTVNDLWQTVGQLANGMTGVGCCVLDVPWFLLENEPSLDYSSRVQLFTDSAEQFHQETNKSKRNDGVKTTETDSNKSGAEDNDDGDDDDDDDDDGNVDDDSDLDVNKNGTCRSEEKKCNLENVHYSGGSQFSEEECSKNSPRSTMS